MGLDLDYADGQTPLDEDEKEGLRIPTIATRGELDEHEQHNIEQALQWVLQTSFSAEKIFTETFIRDVHRKMYGDVWKWAGEFRTSGKNIGVDREQIAPQLRQLLDDAKYWVAQNTYFSDEIAVRFKHRLVSIHCFANGNGRHSRLIADIIIEKIFKKPVFTWGSKSLVKKGDPRTAYLAGLKAADAANIKPLLKFARS